MKFNQLFYQFIALLTILFGMQACVEDDDFDIPEIPPLEELQEVVSEGGSLATFNGCISEDFTNYNNEQTTFDQYENVSTFGTRLWEVNEFAGNSYLRMSAFRASTPIISYFVIPVNFDQADSFSFKTQDRFNNGDPLEVWIITNYDITENIVEADAQEITSSFTIATGNTESNTNPFVPSGSYDLSNLSGNGFIAFKYVGDGTGVTTTIHIDDIEIIDSDDDECKSSSGEAQESKGGNDASPESCLYEQFSDYDVDSEELAKYENATVIGDRFWRVKEFNNNKYIQISAYNGTTHDSWFLVNVDFDSADTFSFKTKDGYNNGNGLSVLYSTSHEIGEEIIPSDWADITSKFTIASGTSSGYADEFTESGTYDLADISGDGFIAFRYVGATGDVTTTYQVDDIMITDADDADCNLISEEICASQDFESFANDDVVLTGYQNIATTGDKKWEVGEYDNNKYVQMSAYNGNGDHEAWMIIGVDFDAASSMSFDTKDGYNNGDVLTVWYSTDYNEEGDPNTANWTDITSEFTIASGSANGYADDFISSGAYSLEQLSGNGYVAFKYNGNSNSLTTTMQIDNIEFTNIDGGSCTYDLPPIDDSVSEINLLISEIADPKDIYKARFVEIYNPNSTAVDLTGWTLSIYANANTDAGATNNLSGSIPANGTFVIAEDLIEFENAFEITPNLDGQVNGNGDDNFALRNPDGVIVDLFGVIGEDGTGTDHEYTDGRAVRKKTITSPNSTYDASEWDITLDVNTTSNEFTPGTHPDEDNSGGTYTDLIISEYAEGSSNNKYIELYNGTGADIDLSNIKIWKISNGGAWTDATEIDLSGVIANNETYIIAHSSADQSILDKADLTTGNANWNGDDAVGLVKDGTLIDAVGTEGDRPDSGWDVAGVSKATKDHTLLRKSTINSPNTDWTESAGTNETDSEWIVLDKNDWSNLDLR